MPAHTIEAHINLKFEVPVGYEYVDIREPKPGDYYLPWTGKEFKNEAEYCLNGPLNYHPAIGLKRPILKKENEFLKGEWVEVRNYSTQPWVRRMYIERSTSRMFSTVPNATNNAEIARQVSQMQNNRAFLRPELWCEIRSIR